jgi:polyketide cyclase/dehydrase/lipid transport protein
LNHSFLALLLAIPALVAAGAADGIEVSKLQVREEGRRYVVEFEAQLAAPPGAVMRVLTDFEGYPALDSRIILARRSMRDGKPLLFTRLRGCVGSVFCRTMDRYELLDQRPGRLVATAIPGEGDLRYGLTVINVEPRDGGTRVGYRNEFDPSFWMPRWIVRKAMYTTLREGTLRMFEAIEARAGTGAG